MFAKREIQFTPSVGGHFTCCSSSAASSPSAHPFVYFVAGPDGAALGDETPARKPSRRASSRGLRTHDPVIAETA